MWSQKSDCAGLIIAQHGEGPSLQHWTEQALWLRGSTQEDQDGALSLLSCTQGRVRTKTVKKASRVIIEKYYQKLTLDFDINKRVAEDVATIQTKRLRNKIAGFTTVSAYLWQRVGDEKGSTQCLA